MDRKIPLEMRSLAIGRYCKPDQYDIMTVPVPAIQKPDDVLIKVHAASINPIDVKIAVGAMKIMQAVPFPYKIGYDCSGTVVSAGTAVSSLFKVGAQVYTRLPEETRGSASEYAICPAPYLALKPSSLSYVEAASLPLVGLTSLQALDKADKYLPGGLKGKTVYVPGGLSGTGSIAVQLAKNVFGAGKVITTLSPGKIGKAPGLLGESTLDQIIDYSTEDAGKIIPAGSVDFLFDTMGVAMPSLHLVRSGGLIVSISTLPSGGQIKLAFAPALPRYLSIPLDVIDWVYRTRAWRWGIQYEYLTMEESASDLQRLSGWVGEGKLRPVVGRTAKCTNLEDVRKGCMEIYEGKGGVGKFVVDIVW